MGTRAKLIAAVALVGLAASVVAIVASAPGCADAAPADAAALVDCVTVDDVRAHQRALQDIADANGGTRAAA